jgi:hypothetical protein
VVPIQLVVSALVHCPEIYVNSVIVGVMSCLKVGYWFS